jgi:hypothetical protein
MMSYGRIAPRQGYRQAQGLFATILKPGQLASLGFRCALRSEWNDPLGLHYAGPI